MKDGNEIEVYYRWCDLDKVHEYGVVCRTREVHNNTWIYWVWYKLGGAFGNNILTKRNFRLLSYDNTWDEKCKLIKEYKTVNNGTDRVVIAIKNHLKTAKIKNHGTKIS